MLLNVIKMHANVSREAKGRWKKTVGRVVISFYLPWFRFTAKAIAHFIVVNGQLVLTDGRVCMHAEI